MMFLDPNVRCEKCLWGVICGAVEGSNLDKALMPHEVLVECRGDLPRFSAEMAETEEETGVFPVLRGDKWCQHGVDRKTGQPFFCVEEKPEFEYDDEED